MLFVARMEFCLTPGWGLGNLQNDTERYHATKGPHLSKTILLKMAALSMFLASLAGASQAAPSKKSLKGMERNAARLNLADCIHIALTQRRDLAILGRAPLSLDDQAKAIKGAVLPSVSLDATYTKSDKPQGGTFSKGGQKDSEVAHLKMNAPLYDFGGTPNRVATAEYGADAKAKESERAQQQVALSVTAQYIRILELMREEKLLTDVSKVVQEQLAASKDFYREGMVAQMDVLAAEAKMAELHQQIIQARNGVMLETAELNRQMGLPPSRNTQLVDMGESKAELGKLDKLVDQALGKRPDLDALGKQRLSLLADYKAYQTTNKPGIGASMTMTFNQGNPFAHKTTLDGALGMRWSLYDSGVLKTTLRIKARTIQDVEDRQADLKDDIALEVQRAWLSLQEARDSIPVARQGVKAATESLRVAREQYGRGLVSGADVLQEEERYERAQRGLFSAIYGVHRSLAGLKFALGLAPEASLGNGKDK